MSQQNTQQAWIYQFLPSESPNETGAARQAKPEWSQVKATPSQKKLRYNNNRPLTSSSVLALTTGMAASLLVLGLLYISANALTVKTEYQRQQLAAEVSRLEKKHQALDCELSQAVEFARIKTLAEDAGMRPADPATESDFITLPSSHTQKQTRRPGWFNQGPSLIVALGHQFRLYNSIGRAEASEPADLVARREQR